MQKTFQVGLILLHKKHVIRKKVNAGIFKYIRD